MALSLDGTTGISASGNITGGNVIASGALIVGSFTPTSVVSSGNITGGNLLTAGLISATGNITGGNILGGANVNATTHTGTTVSVTGNVNGGNLISAALVQGVTVSASGNITGGNVTTAGLISATGAITGGNLSGTNIAGTLTTASQTNITGVGTLTAGTWNANTIGLAYGGTGKTSAPAAMAALMGYTSTTTAAGTTTLTNTSSYYQQFTGTSTQNVVLPVTSTLQTGWTFHVVNNSTGNITVQSSGLNTVIVIIPGTTAMFTCVGTALTSAADWEYGLTDFSTYTGTGDNVFSISPVLTTPNIGVATGTSLSVGAGTITGGNIVNGGANGAGNIGSSTTYFNTIFAKATSAQYADLAENYVADAEYPPGTVVVFGGEKEITVTTQSHDTRVAGIISTDPAYLMNSSSIGSPVALTGRVQCFVRGPVNKGDVLVTSEVEGVAQRIGNSWSPGCVIGKSLGVISDSNTSSIEVVVGRF